MSLQFLLGNVVPFLPLIVAVVVVGLVVRFAYRLVPALLGRPQPSAGGPVTPVGKIVGKGLSALLSPIQQTLAIFAMFLVLSSALFIADHFRLYDDGLVDTTATIVGRSKRCLDPRADHLAALPTAPVCGDGETAGRRVIETLDVTFVGVGDQTFSVAAPLHLAEPGHRAPGDTFVAAYYPPEPLRLGLHLSDNLTIGPEKLLLTGVFAWGLSMAVRQVRRRLAGASSDDEEEEESGGVRGFLRRLFRRGGTASEFVDPMSSDVGFSSARSTLGPVGSKPTGGGFGRRGRPA